MPRAAPQANLAHDHRERGHPRLFCLIRVSTVGGAHDTLAVAVTVTFAIRQPKCLLESLVKRLETGTRSGRELNNSRAMNRVTVRP